MRQFINSTDFNVTGYLHLNVDTIEKNLSRRKQEPRIFKLSTHSIRLFIAKDDSHTSVLGLSRSSDTLSLFDIATKV